MIGKNHVGRKQRGAGGNDFVKKMSNAANSWAAKERGHDSPFITEYS